MAAPDVWTYLVWAGSLVILLLVLRQVWVVVATLLRPRAAASRTDLATRLARSWRAPLLQDAEFAGRLVDITTARVVKQDYRLTLTLAADPEAELDRGLAGRRGGAAIRVDIAAEFRFANIAGEDVVLRVLADQPGETVAQRPTLSGFRVDGIDRTDAGEGFHDIAIATRASVPVGLSSSCRSDLPLMLELPQTLAVRGGAEIRVVSRIRGRIGLIVSGAPEHSFCVDRDDDAPALDRLIRIDRPLLPGENIMLVAGIGHARRTGTDLFGTGP